LTGKGELTVEGEITGSIRLVESRVAVGPNGRVKANIEARDVAVRGQVEGNLRGRERVLLGSTGNVIGDIDAARVVIEDGARFKGRVEIGRAPDARTEREAPKRPAASVPAPAPAAAPMKPAITPSVAPAVPAQTPSTGHSGSSTPNSTPEKGTLVPPAPAGVPGGSR
jgi:cytoskeletal protein CcmA (bactofilin family)